MKSINIEDKDPLVLIKDFEGKSFFINKYQRGYRWGMREIFALLEDIASFDITKNGFYCLQPLVVLNMASNAYELIDGQQRTTTIYLILKFLLQKNYYNILYETRNSEDSGANIFLTNLHGIISPINFDCKSEEVEQTIYNNWKNTFLDENNIEDTIDNFYFYKAYYLIQYWFNQNEKRELVLHNLIEHTKVIWYTEANDYSDVASTFINFNDGKIVLDQAELVKGLFVLDFNTIVDATRKTYEENQFADEWNLIEQHLKKPEFWNFIQRNKSNKQLANKITLLLELEKGKSNKEEDLYYTFRAYEKAFASEEKPEWRSLATLYNLLDEWYRDRETYHLMGAVVHLTDKTIHSVLSEFRKSNKKTELKSYLKKLLIEEFYKSGSSNVLKDKYDINVIKYGKSGVFPLLFLYNLAVAHFQDKKYFFPFDLFNNVRAWNIEHIYAKNSSGFENLIDLKEWKAEIELIIEDQPKLSENFELKDSIDRINLDDLEGSNIEIKKIEQILGDIIDKDNLSNLCLLDDTTNIQVGKKIFRKKREMVLNIKEEDLDKKSDRYIPMATKQVFQKSLTPSNEVRMNYWNTMDRDAYLSDIKSKIEEFLK